MAYPPSVTVGYVKRGPDGAVTQFWNAKYVRARLIVTTGDVGTRGAIVHDETYSTWQDAYRAGAAMMTKLGKRGWAPHDAKPPAAPPKPSVSRSARALPKWLARVPQRVKIERAIARANLEHRADDILSLAKPSIHLRTKRVKKWKGVISRMGGAPDLPKGTKWPSSGKVPYAFLLQLRCEDLAAHDLEGLLPKVGLLSVFLQAWHEHDDYGDDGAVLFFADTRRLASVAPPAAREMQGGPRAVAAIRTSLGLSLPPPTSDPTRALGLNADEMKRYWDRVWLHHSSGGHHVLGYPDMNYNERLKKGVEMLLQICADDAAKYELGDVQPVRCYARRKAIEAKSFSSVVFTAEE
jgi:uncharacterized protein YwqG